MEQGGSHRVDLPNDGFEWKKYGQKFIRSIGKFRSYYKCQRKNCNTKKKAEWSPEEPGDLRVTYEGVHTHASSSAAPSDAASDPGGANRYNLINQVFGHQQQQGSHNRDHN